MLDELRTEINTVDEQILSLFLRRMEVSEKIAAYKAEHHLAVESPAREEKILRWAESESDRFAPYSRELFHCLFTLSKRRQQELLHDQNQQ